MIIGDFNWKKIPNGRKAYDGRPLEDYVLANPQMDKYCTYGSKFYFIMTPLKSNGLYKVIDGCLYYGKECFHLSVGGEYVKNHKHAHHDAIYLVPMSGDEISKKYFNIPMNTSTYCQIAIFDTADEAQKVCNEFNKQLKKKRQKESLERDMAEYERLKAKLGL